MSGYQFKTYRSPVTFANGQTIDNAFIAYNYNATANPTFNRTDNFHSDAQGIIGLSNSCISATGKKLATLPQSMNRQFPEQHPTESFSMCLNGDNGASKMSWGETLPEGMPAMDVDFGCGYWRVQYEAFELYDNAGNLINSVDAAPLEMAEQFSACGPKMAMCTNAPFLDTGRGRWSLNEKDYSGLMNLLKMFYYGKNRADVVALIQKIVDLKGDFAQLSNEDRNSLDEAFDTESLVLKTTFKGDNNPSITKTMDSSMLLSCMPAKDSNLGLSVMNGNIFHFDITNKKLGVQAIDSENGSPLDYLCSSA